MGRGARVSDFFTRNSNLNFFFGGGEGGGGARVSEIPLQFFLGEGGLEQVNFLFTKKPNLNFF